MIQLVSKSTWIVKKPTINVKLVTQIMVSSPIHRDVNQKLKL